MQSQHQNQNNSRTDEAELVVERLLGISLIKEFVFRSPKISSGKQERELADFLVAHDGLGVLFQQKCQQDPDARSDEKNAAWVKKQAVKAVAQLTGAIRKGQGVAMWCQHPRRGKVEFPDGLPHLNHGVVLVESNKTVDLNDVADDLPLEHLGVRISYFTVADFLSLTDELRTLPELIAYLDARKILKAEDLRVVGDEKILYARYLLGGASFVHTKSRFGASAVVNSLRDELRDIWRKKEQTRTFASLMEHVAEELATRDPNMPESMQALYEPLPERTGYLKMQAILANMRVADRIVLGRAFLTTIHKLKASGRKDVVYHVAHLDSLPDTVFVFAAGQGLPREEYPERAQMLAMSALAHHKKAQSITILDRDGEGYELALIKHSGEIPEAWQQAAKHFVADLRVTSTQYQPLIG